MGGGALPPNAAIVAGVAGTSSGSVGEWCKVPAAPLHALPPM
jgi:hypothetical protein